ncbi:MAG: Maf family nucleotide pyrophosphatase [bacterium]|nr:Maf family nucleotide pyrophosphatase [bacterium]
MKIILGSQSQSRKKILEDMGYEVTMMPSHIDEKQIRFEDPKKLTLALAHAKAAALLPRIMEPAILITADQVVVWRGIIREKPENTEEAKSFLRSFHESPQETVGGVVVTNTKTRKQFDGVDVAKIWFRRIPDEVIVRYIESGDPFLHAGGFDHQHPIINEFVERIEGESESIMGLPVALTKRLIQEATEV